ncbi:hypothetical protein [Allosediminivita pacifica]|uniref:Uncharacterized protein n=1 Tax=Allosediminivita pacifica TaxID=1267769 RepID=A0A2T6AWY2_9RHOB|nr:hypothetical protein [Allosediminivita pacifica]PTX48323.1 hypothetical protein C8N44_10913 [Allosediminivita pacifica]
MSDLLRDPRIVAALIAAIVALIVNPFASVLVERVKARLDGRAAERKSRLEYEHEARRRLYTAIGDLRFQLLLAARDVAAQVRTLGSGRKLWSLKLGGYFGNSVTYKLLRPFALCEVIEGKIAIADFGVDPDAIELLRLKRSISKAMSSGDAILEHPDADWDAQVEHIYMYSLSRIAHALIVTGEDGKPRVMTFPEFEAFVARPGNADRLEPVPSILGDFSIEAKPIFWTRLVAYGYICAHFVDHAGRPIGFAPSDYPTEALLEKIEDPHLRAHLEELPRRFEEIRSAGL